MNKRVFFYACIYLTGVFISSISQVILKKSAMKDYGSLMREYLNPMMISAYIIFFLATFLSIFSYRVIPLSMGPILEAAGYIFITVFGVVLFGETFNRKKAAALGLILCGILVYSLLG